MNILDYKGATPLHRAKDAATVEVTWRFCLRPIIRFLLLLLLLLFFNTFPLILKILLIEVDESYQQSSVRN